MRARGKRASHGLTLLLSQHAAILPGSAWRRLPSLSTTDPPAFSPSPLAPSWPKASSACAGFFGSALFPLLLIAPQHPFPSLKDRDLEISSLHGSSRQSQALPGRRAARGPTLGGVWVWVEWEWRAQGRPSARRDSTPWSTSASRANPSAASTATESRRSPAPPARHPMPPSCPDSRVASA